MPGELADQHSNPPGAPVSKFEAFRRAPVPLRMTCVGGGARDLLSRTSVFARRYDESTGCGGALAGGDRIYGQQRYAPVLGAG